MLSRKLTRQDLHNAAEKYKNWGKWGPDDEIGSLNFTQPEDIVGAAQLVRKGKVISLALNFDQHGPPGLGNDALEDRYAITGADLDRTTTAQGGNSRRGDYVIVRTGQMEAKLAAGNWDGYPGGDAPGFSFETLEWIHHNEIAALASDTWGCEVRPNESEPGINQPRHWILTPIMGLTIGEIFYVAELSEDCAEDKTYELMFVAPAIPITGAVGSPTNPLAIK